MEEELVRKERKDGKEAVREEAVKESCGEEEERDKKDAVRETGE